VGRIAGRGSIVRNACLTVAVVALAVLVVREPWARPGAAPGSPGGAAPPGDAAATTGLVEARLRAMRTRDKVGQLFMTYLFGASATDRSPGMVEANRRAYGVDDPAGFVARYRPGGVIYFPWAGNLHQPAQIARLSAGLQRAALRQPARVPLLIATDQEQGLVSRIGPPATQFPGAMALGATGSQELARAAAGAAGAELRAMGIVQDLAPVADVNLNPRNPVIGVRSFGADPALVARLTAAQVAGYQAAGVAATAKHFPGHGDTTVDSHAGLPVIGHSRAQWRRADLPPFQAAIDGGVGAIMSAHIVVPALDPSRRPATLSRPILQGLLRHRLGYDGVVITDALEMAGVRQRFGDRRVPVEAVLAGADMLLMPPRGAFSQEFDAVLAAVRSGRISQARLDQSVRRILRLKARLGLLGPRPGAMDSRTAAPAGHPASRARGRVDAVLPSAAEAARQAGARAHLAVAMRVAEASVTLLRERDGTLPLATHGPRLLVTGSGDDATALLARLLAERGAAARALPTGSEPDGNAIAGAVAAARSSDAVVVLTRDAWTSAGTAQRRLVATLADGGRPVVAVAVRDPYDAAWYGPAAASLATYGDRPASLAALARVLAGELRPAGRLPVAIPATGPGTQAFPIGAGIGQGS
jgi:beta-N-acetylhexosaminidase